MITDYLLFRFDGLEISKYCKVLKCVRFIRSFFKVTQLLIQDYKEKEKMAEPEYDDETLQFAINKEIEAYNFYLALADRVADQRIREEFEALAQEELEHKARLELEVMKLGKTITIEENPVQSEKSYILSNDPSHLDMDYKDMLMLGMEKEEAAFRIYVNLAASAQDEKSREVLLAIAEEEVRHKLRFQIEYDALLKNR